MQLRAPPLPLLPRAQVVDALASALGVSADRVMLGPALAGSLVVDGHVVGFDDASSAAALRERLGGAAALGAAAAALGDGCALELHAPVSAGELPQ